MMLTVLLCVCAHLVEPSPAAEPALELPEVLPLRERAALRDAWLLQRLDQLVPRLMRREGVDTWVLIAREYNEDPCLETMLPAAWMAARRRTILVFHDGGPERDNGRGVERGAVSRYAVGEHFPALWDPEEQPDQWRCLVEWLERRDPERIAVSSSSDFALADGLSASERAAFEAALPERLRGRLVSGECLAVGWLETRLDAELERYREVCRLAHGILNEGLSNAAIEPGETTTEDLVWWYRERCSGLGLAVWFQPTVDLQRAEELEQDDVIRRGDLVHVDFGIRYLGLCTDMQRHAYVLGEGEREPPAGLVQGLAAANRVQDHLLEAFALGRSGNDVLARALGAAREEGLEPLIYTHPLGLHGHGAGPTIGMWDRQEGVPGRGDYPLFASTCYAIELAATHTVPGWGPVRFMLEEDAWFDGKRVRWLDGRQTEYLLVR